MSAISNNIKRVYRLGWLNIIPLLVALFFAFIMCGSVVAGGLTLLFIDNEKNNPILGWVLIALGVAVFSTMFILFF